MQFSVSGTVVHIGTIEQVSEKFRKRDLVVECFKDSQYPQSVKFQVTQDKCDLLNNIKPGDTLEVHFNIRGNKVEKEGKTYYFTNLDAWKINLQSSATESQTPAYNAPAQPPAFESDLPF